LSVMTEPNDRTQTPARPATRDEPSTDRLLALYELVFDQAGVGMAVCALDGRLERVNRALCELLGYAEAELRGRSYLDVTHPDDLEVDRAETERLVAGAVSHYQVEKRYLRKDGRVVWGLLTVALVRDESGTPLQVIAQVQDVSERRRAEAELRASRAQLAESHRVRTALVNTIPDFVWLKDRDGRFVVLNESLARALGRPVETVEGRTADDLFPPELAARFAAQDAAVLAAGTPQVLEESLTFADGAERQLETIKVPLRDPSGAVVGLVGTSRDVTERRRLEDQMRQAQKLEALGLLAGSVAHDFNNLLSVIIGSIDLAQTEVPSGPVAEDLDAARGAASRAAQLTRQLLAFSRRRVRQPRVLDLRDVVRDGEPLLRRLVPDDVVLEVEVGDAPCVVRADPGQLEQVLINLVLNARDAVAERRARERGDHADDAPPPDRPPVVTVEVEALGGAGRAAALAALVVRDTGTGMDAATQARAFEPFFTTKPLGQGTGLGLATVAGIVAESGGSVHVESAPGAGARFTVLLPLVGGALRRLVDERSAPAGGTETVLLVEDETVVRETAQRILVRHGYRVLTARHGGDAVLVWREHGADVDVLLTDLRMPELDGRALVARLRAERPDLPVVLMSGYAGADGDAAFLEREIFLAKPFSTESLLGRVRDAVARARPDGAARARPGA